MGGFSGYFKGENKKKKKEALEKSASHMSKVYSVPQVEILGKKGKK